MNQKQIARQMEISLGSVFNILKANRFHPYHVTIVQHLTERDFIRRLVFCEFVRAQLRDNQDFLFNVLFTDEATFTNNGCVNRHNSHYYAQQNPHWYQEKHFQEVFKVNAWCGIVGNHVIGPHF